MNKIVLAMLLSLMGRAYSFESATKAFAADDVKSAITIQQEAIDKADKSDKGKELLILSLYYLKDQNQEKAFETYLESLNNAQRLKAPIYTDTDERQYQEALDIYLHGRNPKETAQKLIKQFEPILKENPNNSPLAYLVALAHANLNQYEIFFNIFYRAYEVIPDHFLAFKTKGILHIKLMERKSKEVDRQRERKAVLDNFTQALKLQPNDVTLYKLLIIFSPQQIKEKQIHQCLNKIIDDNIIIPRSDIVFYVQEAMDIKDKALAQRFLDKAQEWYPQSRIIDAAQEYIDARSIPKT